ncbi:MAG: iron chelate uptake ABC transporter family permease subunit, partial [Lentisphaeria bacterium]|nr:iron chelate uptake ABC transporter family permease subunit [Lentisphaeria bacterium]
MLRSVPGRFSVLLVLLILLAVSLLLSLSFGALKLSPAEILEILWTRPDGLRFQILYNMRLPRILCGALVGAGLAVSGAILQGVMRNPLAAPGIIGVSSGAG